MTVTKFVSDRFGAVEVEDMLEQQEPDLFLKEEIALAIIDGRHRRFCARKLADSGKQGTEWASQPTRLTLMKAAGSQVFTDQEVLKLSRSPNIMRELVLQDTSLIAVIESVAQCSKTLKSSYDALSDEARISDVCKDLASCEFVQGSVESTYRR